MADRRRLLAEYLSGGMPPTTLVDRRAYREMLDEAVEARNGWKRILRRCAKGREELAPTASWREVDVGFLRQCQSGGGRLIRPSSSASCFQHSLQWLRITEHHHRHRLVVAAQLGDARIGGYERERAGNGEIVARPNGA